MYFVHFWPENASGEFSAADFFGFLKFDRLFGHVTADMHLNVEGHEIKVECHDIKS